jgi:hypothetical protein
MGGNFLAKLIKNPGNDFITNVLGVYSNSLKIQNLRKSVPFRVRPIFLNGALRSFMLY